jgi:signal transduction histidine kinase
LLAVSLNLVFNKKKDPGMLLESFQKKIHQKEHALSGFIREWERYPANALFHSPEILEILDETYTRQGLLLLIYQNDTLSFWSSNAVPVSKWYDASFFAEQVIHLESGWYLLEKKVSDTRKTIALQLIRQEFPYQNKHLNDKFDDSFRLPDEAVISMTSMDHPVYSSGGEYLFSLDFKDPPSLNAKQTNLLFILYFLFLIIFTAALFQAYLWLIPLFRAKLLVAAAFAIDVGIIRFLIFYFKVPHSLYESDLFKPFYYGSSFLLPSLGDLLVNGFLLLFVTYAFFVIVKPTLKTVRLHPLARYLVSVVLFLLTMGFLEGIIYFLKGLILDSSLSLNLSNIFQISYFSLLGFIVIAVLLLSFFLASYKIFTWTYLIAPTIRLYLISIGAAAVIFAFICYLGSRPCNFMNLFFIVIYFLSLWFLRKRKIPVASFYSVVWMLLLFATLSTYTLYRFNFMKEQEQRKWMAVKLTIERDKVTEYLFRETNRKMLADTLIRTGLRNALIDDSAANRLIAYINETYLTPFKASYDIQITLCDENQYLQVQPENYTVRCFDFFNGMVNTIGKPTASDNLWFLDDGTDEINYLAILNYKIPQEEKNAFVFLEIYSKFIPKVLGYPELLIDKKATVFTDLTNYSYAIYNDSGLVKSVGKYFYNLHLQDLGAFTNEFTFVTMEKYDHLVYRVSDSRVIIISTERNSIWDVISPFSYLIIFFGFFTLAFLLVTNAPLRLRFTGASFRVRLQIAIILIILISFLVIGITSLIYIVNLNSSKNQDILSEKTHSVLIELEHKLSGEPELTPELTIYLDGLLTKFSRVFFSDINLYDLNGDLLATSRKEIFQEGLLSTRMNALAYNRMISARQTFFIHRECIGNYEYLSAYVPFMNDMNQIVAYLNLPYFARQSEQKQEISTFLTAFINIYILLIALAIFIALFISGYITQPLQLIREKMHQLQLGRPIEKIGWTGKDEIGDLVSEYNRMTDELAKSAELLARSERESAWREMAKQVAHEIKNPLTPMKLSIQYLQKAWDEKAPDWDQRLNRFTETIVQQIENLSLIASEFSDFAKMPQTNLEKIQLNEIAFSSISLFSNTQHIRFDTSRIPSEPCFVLADKTQMVRVFNNLIKNSVQAIPTGRPGLIIISILSEPGMFRIDVQDNGTGIPAAQVPKIFSPSFTTKSGGMGLGLAIVRSIILNSGGNIWFESEEGNGTTFSFRLPAWTENQ